MSCFPWLSCLGGPYESVAASRSETCPPQFELSTLASHALIDLYPKATCSTPNIQTRAAERQCRTVTTLAHISFLTASARASAAAAANVSGHQKSRKCWKMTCRAGLHHLPESKSRRLIYHQKTIVQVHSHKPGYTDVRCPCQTPMAVALDKPRLFISAVQRGLEQNWSLLVFVSVAAW